MRRTYGTAPCQHSGHPGGLRKVERTRELVVDVNLPKWHYRFTGEVEMGSRNTYPQSVRNHLSAAKGDRPCSGTCLYAAVGAMPGTTYATTPVKLTTKHHPTPSGVSPYQDRCRSGMSCGRWIDVPTQGRRILLISPTNVEGRREHPADSDTNQHHFRNPTA